MPNDASYYRARAAKERTMAALSTNPKVAAIHREMADNYATLAWSAGDPIEKAT